MSKQKAAEKIMAARCRLLSTEPWYGHMSMSIEWISTEMEWITNEEDRTLGMCVQDPGVVKCYYNPDWILKTSIEQIYGTIEHAINHLIRLHTLRQRHLDEQAWNIATDMAVNGHEHNPHIGFKENSRVIVKPHDNMVWVPRDWSPSDSAEHYYEKIMEQMPKQQEQGQQGQGQGQGQDQEGDGEGEGEGGGNGNSKSQQQYQAGKFSGTGLDNHQIWNRSNVSQDEARQLIHDMAKQASERTQGHVPGHLKEVLEALAKPIIRWREILRQYLGKHVGNNRKTWSRLNRRYGFGTKGVSHHAAAEVSVVVDTSGSIGTQELEQFFAEIEAIAYKAKVHVLQWDHAYQGFARYRRGDWRNITVNGRGGTDMVAPVEWLEQNGVIGDICVMLTDGYCSWPTRRQFPMLFVITTSEQHTDGPDWGEIVRMQIAD